MFVVQIGRIKQQTAHSASIKGYFLLKKGWMDTCEVPLCAGWLFYMLKVGACNVRMSVGLHVNFWYMFREFFFFFTISQFLYIF